VGNPFENRAHGQQPLGDASVAWLLGALRVGFPANHPRLLEGKALPECGCNGFIKAGARNEVEADLIRPHLLLRVGGVAPTENAMSQLMTDHHCKFVVVL
jgi:hypothetical protein